MYLDKILPYLPFIISLLVALITALIGPWAIEIVKFKLGLKKSKTPIQEAIEVNELVENQLQIIIEEMECDRVWVAQFHNGGHFYPTGKSIQKFSIFYEKFISTTTPIQHNFQNVPCSLFPKALSHIYKHNELEIFNVKEIGNDYNLGTFLEIQDLTSFYLIGIYNLEDNLIGLLCLNYNEEYKLNSEDLNFIRQKSGVIGTLLSNYLKI